MQVFKIIAVLFSLLCIAGQISAQTAEIIAPNVFLQGMVLTTGVRYTATFIKPEEALPLRNISVEITLPPGAQFSQMLVPQQVEFDVVRVSREGAITMIWQTSRVPGENTLDSYSFTLAQPLTEETEFYIQWQDENGTQYFENFFELPPLAIATQNTGIATLSQQGFVPAGETGVQVSIPQQAEPVTLTVNILPAGVNPPPEYGDLWWCSLVEITGLPEGVSASVIVPLRRPVAPFTPLSMFQQNDDGSWSPLEGEAFVTADGQYVVYEHPGGVVATGGLPEIQPEIIAATNIQVITDAGLAAPANAAPDLTNITDGTSNTVLLNEIPVLPPPENITDGTSNTVMLGELPLTATPIPLTATPVINTINDGSSNTVLLGEPSLTATPILPTATPIINTINDGSSNTVLLGEPSLTATPITNETQVAPPTATPAIVLATSTSVQLSIPTAAPIPNLPRVVVLNPTPVPGGYLPIRSHQLNAPRIEIHTQLSFAPVQCQIGRINCVLLLRRIGGGFR